MAKAFLIPDVIEAEINRIAEERGIRPTEVVKAALLLLLSAEKLEKSGNSFFFLEDDKPIKLILFG